VSDRYNQVKQFTELLVPTPDYNILIMGDSHAGGTGNLDKFIGIAESANTTAIVMAGDLTNGHDDEFEEFEKHLPLSVPYFAIAGNHDMNFGGWDQFSSRFHTSTFCFTVKTPAASDLYICLETGAATLGEDQMNWFREVLKQKRSSYRFCVVITHNNFFLKRHTLSTYMNNEEMYVLLDLFARYRVDMMISAHDHVQYAEEFAGTQYLVLPALEDGSANPGYLSLDVKNNSLISEFVNFR
jgi:predicted phosphodiesterase